MSKYNSKIVSDLLSFLSENLRDFKGKSILEVGIGIGWLGYWLRLFLESNITQYQDWNYFIDGIESFLPYALIAEKNTFYNRVLIMDLTDHSLNTNFLIGIEVIEHLQPKQAELFLRKAIRNANSIFLTTPNHFFIQNEIHKNPNQKHLCYFNKQFYEKLGLKVKETKNTYFIYSKDLHWFEISKFHLIFRKLIPLKIRKYLIK